MPNDITTLLSNLPSRGNFTTSEATTTRAKGYVCTHDSRPPLNQRLTGDNQPLLIRLLLQKKGRDAELKRKQLQDKEKSAASKRPASGTPATAKRQAAGPSSPTQRWTPQQLRGKSNNDLSQLLKSYGGKPSGKKKDELIQGVLQLQPKQGS